MNLNVDIKDPSFYAELDNGHYDCTGHIGPFGSEALWPMYSFNRPAYIIWNAIAQELYANGWTDEQIKEWLQSKNPRWSLDAGLGRILEQVGRKFARDMLKS